MKARRISGLMLSLLFLGSAFPAPAQEMAAPATITVVSVEYRIDGITKESALSAFLGVEAGMSFADESALAAYVEALGRRLDNERIFDLASGVAYELSGDGTEATILVYARDSLNALAIPLPKYSGAEGFSVAVKYKDFNFLGTMEPLSANAEWFVEDGIVTLGGDFSLPFMLAGADWSVSVSGDLALGEGQTLAPNASAAVGARWPADWLGLGWSWGPDLSYAYNRSQDRHTIVASATARALFDTPIGLSAWFTPSFTSTFDDETTLVLKGAVGSAASLTLASLPWSGALSWKPSAQVYATADPMGTADADFAVVLDQWVGTGRIDLDGNFRKGFSGAARATWGWHPFLPAADAQELAFSLDGSAFGSLEGIVGVNLRVTGRWFAQWTLWDRASTWDWGALVRGGDNALYGDAGLVLNAELPVNFAQGLFFDASFLEAEVHLVPFLDLGLVRPDPDSAFSDAAAKIFRGGLDIVVYPAKARAFTYRLSVGYDLGDFLETDDFKSELLEIWLGLGLHF